MFAVFDRRRLVRLLAALLLPVAVGLLQWLFWAELRPYAWVLFFPVVFLAPFLGGPVGGAGATLLSTLIVWYVFLPPQFSFHVSEAASPHSIAIFLATGLGFSAFFQLRRNAQVRYRTLFDRAGDGIAIIDAHGRYRDANPAYCAMVGLPRTTVVGTNVTALVNGMTPAMWAAQWAELERAGVVTVERRLRRADGTLLPVEVIVTPLQGRQRLSVVHDTSARQQIDDMLKLFKLAAGVAGLGIWTWDLSTDQLGWDDRLCELYEVPAATRQSGLYYDFWRARVHPDELEELEESLTAARSSGAYWEQVFRIVLPGGRIRFIHSAAVTDYDHGDQPLRMVGVNRDVTQQHEQEMYLQAMNAELEREVAARTADLAAAVVELQHAGRLKDEFLAMISHELRTPLTGVLSMAEMLGDEIAGPLTARQSYYVKGINESGERLLQVVNGILSYTHLLSGKVQLQDEPVDLAHLLAVCAASQRHKAAARQQTIAVSVAPSDLAITSDATAIADVLKRLLDNAIKFTPAGGQIGLEARCGAAAESAERPSGEVDAGVELAVWDTGIGIAADQMGRILKPFTQADGRLARSHEGIGLGLAYVDQMVRLLNGTLAVDSEVGRGSRFTVILPQDRVR